MPPMLSSQMRQGTPGGAAEGPPPDVWEEIGARAEIYVDEDPDGVSYRRHRAYEPLIQALQAQGVSDADMKSRADVWGISVPGSEDWDYRKIYDLARRRGLGDLRKDRAEFEAVGASRAGYARRRQIAERGGRWWTELPLGIVQSFQPEYGPLPALGLPAKTILGAAAREAAINVLFEGVEIARTKDARDTLGNPITGDEVLARGLMAAGGGALFGAGGKALPMGVDAVRGRFETLVADNWDRLPQAIRDKWGSAAKVDDTALPDIFEALVGRDNMSVQEKGAVAVLRRDAELARANPFRPDGAGVEAHQAAVLRNVERVQAEIEGLQRPIGVAAARDGGTALSSGTIGRTTVKVPGKPGQVGYANDIYQYFRSKGLSDAQARGIAAGIHAESASNHNVRGGYKGRAVGLGQWLGERRAELLRRYGPTPTRRQQLDFMWEELQGRDAGGRAVLAATDERAVLDAYIRKFMRPAPGAQTTGDLTRGMAALGRGGETMHIDDMPTSRAGDAGDGVDPEAAVTADLAQRGAAIDAERAALDQAGGAAVAREAGEGIGDDLALGRFWDDGSQRFVDMLDIAPMPELRRDLFPDAASWREAQSTFEAEALGLAEPMVTRRAAWIEARQELEQAQAGEILGALTHPEIGPIDVKWGEPGKSGYGLAKIIDKHPEVVDDLPAILGTMSVKSRTDNRIVLESADHKAVVRLEWDGKAQTWLLSAYERKGKAPPQRTTDVPGIGARDGSPTREAAAGVAENRAPDNAALPMERLWGADDAPRDAGGLTAAERASLDFDEPGLAKFDDAGGEGVKLDIDDGLHDLRASIDREDPANAIAFAARDGADETPAQALAAIDAEEAALTALRGCL